MTMTMNHAILDMRQSLPASRRDSLRDSRTSQGKDRRALLAPLLEAYLASTLVFPSQDHRQFRPLVQIGQTSAPHCRPIGDRRCGLLIMTRLVYQVLITWLATAVREAP